MASNEEDGGNGFSEYKKLIIESLHRLEGSMKEMRTEIKEEMKCIQDNFSQRTIDIEKKINELELQIKLMQLKASMPGIILGFIAVIISILVGVKGLIK